MTFVGPIGDRSSVGSAGSVGSTRSAGSGQSSESGHKQNGGQSRLNADVGKVRLALSDDVFVYQNRGIFIDYTLFGEL